MLSENWRKLWLYKNGYLGGNWIFFIQLLMILLNKENLSLVTCNAKSISMSYDLIKINGQKWTQEKN